MKTYLFIWKGRQMSYWSVMRLQGEDAAAAEALGKKSLLDREAAKSKSSPFSVFPIEFYVAEPANRQVTEWAP